MFLYRLPETLVTKHLPTLIYSSSIAKTLKKGARNIRGGVVLIFQNPMSEKLCIERRRLNQIYSKFLFPYLKDSIDKVFRPHGLAASDL